MEDEHLLIKGDKNAHQHERRASLYVVALDRYFGIRDLTPRIRDSYGYDFDFYAHKNRCFIKVFSTIDEMEVDRYMKNPTAKKIRFIIDISDVLKPPRNFLRISGDAIPKPFANAACRLSAPLFFKGRMFIPFKYPDGKVSWLERSDTYDLGYQEGFNDGYEQCMADIDAEKEEKNQNAQGQY